MFLIWDFSDKDGFSAFMLPYKNKNGEIFFEEPLKEKGLDIEGPLKEAFASGFIKEVIKESVSFESISEKAQKNDSGAFDLLVSAMEPVFARLMDDYPYFLNDVTLKNWRKFNDPTQRFLTKENIDQDIDRMRNGGGSEEEDDRPWEK